MNSQCCGVILGTLALFFLAGGTVRSHAQEFNLEEQVQVCNACHGEKGIPPEKTTPVIWGQHLGYTYLQLKDFKSKDRVHEVMNAVAEPLVRKDMLALAEYFANKPWPRTDAKSASEEVAFIAARSNSAVGCTGCHQDGYKGEGTQARLAGQTREYLLKTMFDIRTGERGNNAGMTTLMKATSEEDLTALAEYLAALTLSQ
jgi:cytochrome c553